MPIVTPDFEEKRLIPGWHNGVVIGAEVRTSKAGKPYVLWGISVESHNLRFMTGLSGKGAQALRALVRATYNPAYDAGEVDTGLVVGHPVRCNVVEEPGEDGRLYLKIIEVGKIPSIHVPSASSEDIPF